MIYVYWFDITRSDILEYLKMTGYVFQLNQVKSSLSTTGYGLMLT